MFASSPPGKNTEIATWKGGAMAINVIDILLVLAFLAIVAAGFIGGVIRLLFVLVALYLGVIVAGLFYVPIGLGLSSRLSAIDPFTAELVSFFLLMAGATVALSISLLKTFATLRLPRYLAGLDQTGGAALGVVAATFTVVVATVVLSFFFGLVTETAAKGVQVSPVLLSLALQLRASFLARYFVDLSAPLFVLIVPWFPNGLPAILVVT
jgi:uncharacterized membrane protein required for colicin V production